LCVVQIIRKTTVRYNPQQNGKYELFWPTIEMAPTPEDVPALIAEYNETPHFGLPEIMRGRGMSRLTPNEACGERDLHWRPGVDPAWMVLHTHFHKRKSSNTFGCGDGSFRE
jgi:hypothetical protein